MTVTHTSMLRRASRSGVLKCHLEAGKKHDEASISTAGHISGPGNRYEGIAKKKAREEKVSLPSRVKSSPSLTPFSKEEESAQPLKKRCKRSESEFCLQLLASTAISQKPWAPPKREAKVPVKPEDHLQTMLAQQALSMDFFQVSEASFLPIKELHLDSYPQAARAARDEDLEALRRLDQQGINLQCSNRYGESIVHIVCRRGNDSMLEFLTEKAKVSMRLRDDLGRTPLHDAAWTDKPNFKLVRRILSQEPDLLFVRDKRGHSPLAYVPPQNWGVWCNFFDENVYLIQAATDRLVNI